MEQLEFKTSINATKEKVWHTMTDAATYQEWVDVAWPGSYYEGEWVEGNHVKFLNPGQGGTLAKLEQNDPYKFCLARHVAIIKSDGTEDRESDIAKGWIDSTESYRFTESDGGTELEIEILTKPDWLDMFKDGWPIALVKLKEMCERE